MPQVRTLSPSAEITEICAATDEDGAVVVPDLFSPAEIAALNAEIDPWLERQEHKEFLDADAGRFYRRLTGLVSRSDTAVSAFLNPRIIGWAEALLGGTGSIQLNTAQVLEIHPGAPAQILHSDEGNWPPFVTGPDTPELMCSCMVALTDFTEENGATRILPGSQRDDTDWLSMKERPETVPAEMKAGSVLFFTGKVAHGGGANRSDRPRRGLTITFCAGWLRPEEAISLSVTRERALELPERLRELIGFGSYRRDIGGKTAMPLLWLHDMDDASTFLKV